MIPARRSALFTWWFTSFAARRLHRSFASLKVHGLSDLASLSPDTPLLIVSNHTSWWDPLLALYLSDRVLRRSGYAMMDATNLRRLPFFGKVGAFGVDLNDPFDGARAIRYATKLVRAPRNLVWIFAQGRETPVTLRPLGFRGGAPEVARLAKACVIPTAIRYELGSVPEPRIFVSFGVPIPVAGDVATGTALYEAAVTTELDRIDSALCRSEALDFTTLFAKTPSPWQTFAERGLAWLTRPSSTSARDAHGPVPREDETRSSPRDAPSAERLHERQRQ